MAVAMIGPKFYAWDRNGKPLAFGKLYTYQASTNTPKPTYQSEDQVVENTNPVILNGEGYADVYLSGSYKMVLKDKDENEIWSSDPVSSAQPDEWVNCSSATYAGSKMFIIPGNVTTSFDQGRRVRIDNNAADYAYSTIESAVFAASETTVTVTDAVVTAGIREVCTSIVGPESRGASAILSFDTLNEVLESVIIKEGDVVNYGERATGNGGGATADIVLTSSVVVSPDTAYGRIMQCSAQPDLAVVIRTKDKVNVKQFGVYTGDDYAVTNCDAYASVADYINSRGGYIEVIWPSDSKDYQFSPKDNTNFNASDNSWRNKTELVDVKGVYHKGYGATVRVNADPTWFRGNSNTGSGAVAIGMDESPIQFRATTEGACSLVGVLGLKVETTDTIADSSGTYPDGSALGIAYRGCQDTCTKSVVTRKWGTDGIYYGTAYSSAFGGKNHYLENPKCIANYRQGVSVVGNDDGTVVGGNIEDTFGSSFGYAIDFEPNSADGRQGNWHVTGLKTRNNERGACNHIRSENITWDGCVFDEQRNLSVNSGCVRFDGSLDSATLTNNIKFHKCTIIGLKASIYANGNYVDNVSFDDCDFKCTGDVSVDSQFRINAGTNADFGTFKITNSRIYGNGGLSARGATGGLDTKVIFKNNEWYPGDEGAATPAWIFDTHSPFVEAIVEGNTIDFTKGGWTKVGTYQPYIPKGVLDGNVFESTSGFVVEWRDWGAGREVVIGTNTWGTYSHYDGVVSGLDIKTAKAGVQQLDVVGGDFGLPRRVVHGGYQRVSNYASTPGSFVGAQEPEDGDITYNLANNQATRPQTSYIYDSDFGGWILNSYVTLKGTTGARPPADTFDQGLQYLDTTLAANGKPIIWTGTAWVDSTGASV